jgi:hypothetical protein
VKALLLFAALALLPLCAHADTTLVLDTKPLPKDTLIMGATRIVGTAVPSVAAYVHGDMNFDGQVSTSDVMLLIRKVLLGSPLPTGDTISIQVVRAKGADTTLFTFLPLRAGKR